MGNTAPFNQDQQSREQVQRLFIEHLDRIRGYVAGLERWPASNGGRARPGGWLPHVMRRLLASKRPSRSESIPTIRLQR